MAETHELEKEELRVFPHGVLIYGVPEAMSTSILKELVLMSPRLAIVFLEYWSSGESSFYQKRPWSQVPLRLSVW